jgi:hydroxypyruvate isomerase
VWACILAAVLQYSANISLLFREVPLLERFAAARAAGFAAVEIQIPYEHPAESLTRAAQAAGVRVVLINAPMGPVAGAPGMACRPELRHLYRAELERACEYASALSCPCVNVLAGRTAIQERVVCERLLIEHLSLAAERLGAVSARPLLEVINPHDAPGYLAADFVHATRILRACDPRVRLQFDVYHAARLGLDPRTTFIELRPIIAHVQFADHPGRHEPGSGTLPLTQIFDAIAASGYEGWVGAEYHPTADTLAGLGWMRVPALQG